MFIMNIPKYHETFIPILEVLNKQGVLHYSDLALSVRNQYYSHLPQELRDEKISSGGNRLLNRIGWVRVL